MTPTTREKLIKGHNFFGLRAALGVHTTQAKGEHKKPKKNLKTKVCDSVTVTKNVTSNVMYETL